MNALSQPRPAFVAEPPGRWIERPPAVVDCSILAAFLWCEVAAGEAERVMAGLALHAPVLLKYELANVARNKMRSGVPWEVACSGVDALGDQRLVFHDVEPVDLLDIAARYGLTAYDAAYLALADRLRAPLLTLDQRLAEAAARHFKPEA